MKSRIEDRLFNGYVRNPVPMVFFAVFVAIALLILALWATIDSFGSKQYSISAVAEVFVEYKQDGPIVELLTVNGQRYDLPTDAVSDNTLLQELIKSSVPVWVEYSIRLDAVENSRNVLSISALDNSSIISIDAIAQARLEDKYIALCVLWGACLLYLTFLVTSYYFISHAPQFPHISSLLVREPYRNF